MICYTIIYKKNIILKVWHLLLCSTLTQYQKIFVNWLYMALFTEEDICYRKKISQIHDSRLNLIHVYNRLGTMHIAHKKTMHTAQVYFASLQIQKKFASEAMLWRCWLLRPIICVFCNNILLSETWFLSKRNLFLEPKTCPVHL